MSQRIFICVCSVLSATLIGCSDNRPDIAEAVATFTNLYPCTAVLSIKKTEDEVVACSYQFQHQKSATGIVKTIDIQFMEAENRVWKPNPKPPEDLP
jgi:hypothetical protein